MFLRGVNTTALRFVSRTASVYPRLRPLVVRSFTSSATAVQHAHNHHSLPSSADFVAAIASSAASSSALVPHYRCARCFPQSQSQRLPPVVPARFRQFRYIAMSAAATAPSSAAAAKAAPVYRHYRSDFGPLKTQPLHLDLDFDMREDRVTVMSTTTFLHVDSAPLTVLKLNSRDLQIQSVEVLTGASKLDASKPSSEGFVAHVASFAGAKTQALKYEIDNKDHFLNITLPSELKQHEQLVVRIVSVATPTAHILEGLYYDYTPEGQPRTIITQCQQYGFQRIVPSLDHMTAKAYYTTRITADKRYSHIITNGDLAPGYVDPATNKPKYQPAAGDENRVTVQYNNHLVNMASYLFFLGCGTYDCYSGEFEYCDGVTATAELLVFPNLVEPRHARTALQSLIDSIYWCYLSTGPEALEHEDERKKIYALIPRRDELKKLAQRTEKEDEELAHICAELKRLISVWKKTGYQYTGKIYREISMQNSDYGGMENVGNTTILASRMVPSDLLVDPGYLYMEGVKIHEFYHNINGSEVTGQSPFEIWLNEAVTVYIQRQREDALFGADFMRIKEVLYNFMPGQGPLAIDDAPTAMAIEPAGFNRTQELISAATYSKAPEFVNMIALTIGEDTFNRGLDYYHTKFKYSNATTNDWIESMEKLSGQKLKDMADGWLRRPGHPHVLYSGSYDSASSRYTVTVEQIRIPAGGQPWIFPISWALLSAGKETHKGVWHMREAKQTFVVENVKAKPDFCSFARGWSFFGTFANTNADHATLAMQAMTDTDIVGRYFAYRAVVDAEKAAIIENLSAGKKDRSVSNEFVELHAKLLFDETVNAGARASVLREGEDIHSRPDLAHLYWQISDARIALLQAVYDAHAERIISMYTSLEAHNTPGPHLPQLHERALKHHLFLLIAAGNKPDVLTSRKRTAVKADVSAMARQLLKSSFMSDRVFGLAQFLSGPASRAEKEALIAEVKPAFAAHPDSIESWVAVITGLDSDDAPQLIRELIADKQMFNVAQAGHARTAVRSWANIRKRSLLTDEGLALTIDLFHLVGRVNQYSAQSFIAALGDLPKFSNQPEQQKRLVAGVRKMRDGLDKVKEESLFNQLTALLAPYAEL